MENSEARKRKEQGVTGGTRGVDNDPDVLRDYGLNTHIVQSTRTYRDSEGPTTEAEFLSWMDAQKRENVSEDIRVTVKPMSDPTFVWVDNAPGEEVRITASSGGQKGSKPARYDLIPTDALEMLARHYGKGNTKYPAVNGLDNWRNGYPWSLSYAAMQRHLHAFWSGEDYDAETGSLHLVAAMWHCATLIHFHENYTLPPEYDDRQDVLDRMPRPGLGDGDFHE